MRALRLCAWYWYMFCFLTATLLRLPFLHFRISGLWSDSLRTLLYTTRWYTGTQFDITCVALRYLRLTYSYTESKTILCASKVKTISCLELVWIIYFLALYRRLVNESNGGRVWTVMTACLNDRSTKQACVPGHVVICKGWMKDFHVVGKATRPTTAQLTPLSRPGWGGANYPGDRVYPVFSTISKKKSYEPRYAQCTTAQYE